MAEAPTAVQPPLSFKRWCLRALLPDVVNVSAAGAQDPSCHGDRYRLLRAAAAADFPDAMQGWCVRRRPCGLELGGIRAELPDGAGVHQAGEQGSCAETSGRS